MEEECAGCTFKKKLGKNNKFCDRHRSMNKKKAQKRGNIKRIQNFIQKNIIPQVVKKPEGAEDLLDLNGQFGFNVFSSKFDYWEKVSEIDKIRLQTHTQGHNTLTRHPCNPNALSIFASELNECVSNHLGDNTKAHLVACKSSTSELVNLLPNLSNWAVRRYRDLGSDVNGEVILMEQCYGSGVPSPNQYTFRKFIRDKYIDFIPRSDDELKRNDVVSFPITPLFFEYENEGGLTGAEKGCINWLNERFEKSLVGVLFMELITSYEVKGLRRVFLKKLRQLCNDHKVLIVVDNSMTSIRCGYFFDFLFYDQDFIPDFVLVGKHWGYSYMFHLFSVLNPIFPSSTVEELEKLNGEVTTPVDNCTILRTITFLKVIDSCNFLEKIRENGQILIKHLRDQANRMYKQKTSKKSLDSNPYEIRGTGALFFTDLFFSGNISTENIEFNRLLVKFDCNMTKLTKILIAVRPKLK